MFAKISSFHTANTIISGLGSIKKLGGFVKKLSSKKVLIVTDEGVISAKIIDKIIDILKSDVIKYCIYSKVEHDPSIESIQECYSFSNEHDCDLIIAVGGGSSIDVAKIVSVLKVSGGEINDYFGLDNVPSRGLPTIAIPTTAGTGSEVTPVAVISVKQEHKKIGIQSPNIIPDVAIIDPFMTLTCPPTVTAATGMDAFTHAVEAYLSINNSSITDMFALEAIKLISSSIRSAVAKGENVNARTKMCQGSLYAGIAFANAGTAAVHAIAMTIGGVYDIPHGVANAMLLPFVMKYNALSDLNKMANIAAAMQENISSLSPRDSAMKAIDAVKQLSIDVNVMHSLKEFGAKKEEIPGLAQKAIKVTRLLRNNPRNVNKKDLEKILLQVY